MTWWLWILLGVGVLSAGYVIGLFYAHTMMQRGQSSFFRESIPRRSGRSYAVNQKRIEVLECKIARLEHIADLADEVVKNAWSDEYAFNPETYTVIGDDVAKLSVALMELEFAAEVTPDA